MPAPLRTVIVDDSDDLRLLLRRAFERAGHFAVVGEAGDAAGARDAVTSAQPELVVLDLALGTASGLDLLDELRELAPDSRVVVVSAFPAGRLREIVQARGAVGYVRKTASLRCVVDEVIEVTGVLDVVEGVLESISASFPGHPASGSQARRFVAEALDRWDCAAQLDVVKLLVTELVANAVLHAASVAEVSVLMLPDAVRVEVRDDDPSLPARRDALDLDTSGRGLALIDGLSRAWGAEATGSGKVVWFEVDRFDHEE